MCFPASCTAPFSSLLSLLLKSAIRTPCCSEHHLAQWNGVSFFKLSCSKKWESNNLLTKRLQLPHLPDRCLCGCMDFLLLWNHNWVIFLQPRGTGTHSMCTRVRGGVKRAGAGGKTRNAKQNHADAKCSPAHDPRTVPWDNSWYPHESCSWSTEKGLGSSQAKAQAQLSACTDQCGLSLFKWDANAHSREIQAGHFSATIYLTNKCQLNWLTH